MTNNTSLVLMKPVVPRYSREASRSQFLASIAGNATVGLGLLASTSAGVQTCFQGFQKYLSEKEMETAVLALLKCQVGLDDLVPRGGF